MEINDNNINNKNEVLKPTYFASPETVSVTTIPPRPPAIEINPRDTPRTLVGSIELARARRVGIKPDEANPVNAKKHCETIPFVIHPMVSVTERDKSNIRITLTAE